MKNYFTLSKVLDLTVNEQIIYALISGNSDSKVSKITREKLLQLSGLSELKTISNITDSLSEKNLLRREHYFTPDGMNHVNYWLNKPSTDYILCSRSLFELPTNLMAVAIKIASLRWKDTKYVYLNNKEIYTTCKLSKNTFTSYRNQLVDLGVLEVEKKRFVISTDYFPLANENTEFIKKVEKDMLTLKSQIDADNAEIEAYNKNHRGNKRKERVKFPRQLIVFLYYYKNDYEDLHGTKEQFLKWCLTGCSKDTVKPALYTPYSEFLKNECNITDEIADKFSF